MRYDGTDRRVHIKVTGFTPNLPEAQPFPADEILIAPDSGRVLATASNYVYLVTLPLVGAAPPAINVADTAAASFPVHRLTRIGGDFIGWAPDAKTVYWSIGRSFFRYRPAVADSLAKLKEPQELQLIKRISANPEDDKQCAALRAPHSLVHYLRDLANDFHTYYSAHQFIVEDAGARNARLDLALATQIVISNGLKLLGVSAPDTM
jgi:hypothetical protein